jgi:2-amino-4-hydroxy-6-hydroxymethyldihydropteridine diphosphokinase
MTAVTLSLGSNRQAEKHIAAALDALYDKMGDLTLSRVYESEAVGFDGDNFLNMVVRADTSLTLSELSAWLKALEDSYGRDRQQARFSSRTLDVDVLTFNGLHGTHEGIVLPRPEITRNAFVLWPLAEVYGDGRDPLSGKSYARLWQEYDRSNQRLWPVSFIWRGKHVSSP